ncbi:hypothetical protein ACHQM5_011372 [Ranunculus cassubicifolius]
MIPVSSLNDLVVSKMFTKAAFCLLRHRQRALGGSCNSITWIFSAPLVAADSGSKKTAIGKGERNLHYLLRLEKLATIRLAIQ